LDEFWKLHKEKVRSVKKIMISQKLATTETINEGAEMVSLEFTDNNPAR
jgi:hypothetical protein